MSNYIVLVKQVPDISQISDNAFNPETGTLIRSKLANVINDLDAQALAFAHQMRALKKDESGKIIVLSMGPPMADEVLRYSLSRCADTAILLTDRLLGGADTVATANPLAFAIRKIVKEILNNSEDYYIITGMQSVDGDTAQVPAQIASELGISCIGYATHVAYEGGRFEFSSIITGGSQTVAARKMPIVITVAKYEHALFPQFALTRKANATQIITWGAADINATQIGLKGSRTQVTRVFPPEKTTRQCKQITNIAELAEIIRNTFKEKSEEEHTQSEKKAQYVLPERRVSTFDRSYDALDADCEAFALLERSLQTHGITNVAQITEELTETIAGELEQSMNRKQLDELLVALKIRTPKYSGDVWVAAECDEGEVILSTFELIGKARELADSLKVQVGVIIAGESVSTYGKALIAAGADKIYSIESPLLKDFDPITYEKVFSETVQTYKPQIVLYAATPQGRALAPMVSYNLGCGLTADCTSLDIKDRSKKGEIAVLLQTRPALGGNVMATICTVSSSVQMATARPGVMKRIAANENRIGEIIPCPANISKSDLSIEIIAKHKASGKVNFDVPVIVSGGKGLRCKQSFEQLLDELKASLHETLHIAVEEGATRAAVEQGFCERLRQIGQTGTAVAPQLYIALGISGAIQHMIGVANAGTIIAVNNDPSAPIFKQCDYYIVGNVEDIVPQLVEALAKEE
ncbi:MAG: FAD-binding protein [Bacteroidales bacterium]|jgi:electron transfer flavoprotein alpha subunit|nr:FAD-binding protein [Bacteroidales bacterium]